MIFPQPAGLFASSLFGSQRAFPAQSNIISCQFSPTEGQKYNDYFINILTCYFIIFLRVSGRDSKKTMKMKMKIKMKIKMNMKIKTSCTASRGKIISRRGDSR